ncbi:MAG: integration host factor subunit beta [Chitinispirillales bacterium]|jgi:DNA-binding protein HU-beta/integration host factor subunit beta|nr:integration host factor subunit beta [Chitinispirillales bacterium]
MSVGREDLARMVSEKTGLNLLDAKLVIASFLDMMKAELIKGKRIELRGFGRFFVKERKSRAAKNPKTGQKINIDRRFNPAFKISDKIVKKLNEKQGK